MPIALRIKKGDRFILPEGGIHSFEREFPEEKLLC
jgi:hypothetical protein